MYIRYPHRVRARVPAVHAPVSAGAHPAGQPARHPGDHGAKEQRQQGTQQQQRQRKGIARQQVRELLYVLKGMFTVRSTSPSTLPIYCQPCLALSGCAKAHQDT